MMTTQALQSNSDSLTLQSNPNFSLPSLHKQAKKLCIRSPSIHLFSISLSILFILIPETVPIDNCHKELDFLQIISCYIINKKINQDSILKKMNNPAYKNIRQRKNELSAITTLILGKEPIETFSYKEIRYDTSKESKIVRHKYSAKMDEIDSQLNFLKINGKEINSNNNQAYKVKTVPKIYQYRPQENSELNQPQKNIYPQQIKPSYSEDRRQFTKSHPNISLSYENTYDQIKAVGITNFLPERSVKESISNHVSASKKQSTNYEEQKSLQQIEQIEVKPKIPKRRQNLTQKIVVVESQKQKMDSKKSNNYLLFREFIFTINLTNNLLVYPEEQILYKAYICKGNNGLLVKSILKTRPWWSFKPLADIDSCNLIWTEWKRNKSISILPNNKHKGLKQVAQVSFSQKNINNKENKENKEKMDRKMNNFSKIVGKNNNIYNKFDESSASQNYLSFSNKFNSKNFEQYLTKSFPKGQFDICDKNYEKSLVNHIPGCYYLHSKKFLFLSMRNYYQKQQKDIFSVIPITFLVTKGINDPQFQKFTKYYEEVSKNNKSKSVWICKPGQNSNRGNGIEVVSSIAQIRSLITQKCTNGRTLIIQKYMQNPFLYNKRKFDIRCYIVITCVNGVVKGYWYEEGYVRTTSKEYNLKNLDNKLIHLTNDAIQKKGQEYGKFQNFNKVSFNDLEKYIESTTEYKFAPVYQQIKALAVDLILSVAPKINPQHKEFTFQVFGLDFMLDDKLNPYLIEANSNPCLSVDGNVLAKVIPPMIQNVIRIAIDPLFPPPKSQTSKNRFNPGNTFEINRMMLVYDSFYDFPVNSTENEMQLMEDKECEQFEGEIEE